MGLYYLQSRYYDPERCRFLNADAYISTGQGELGNNMFAYCRNNPVCRIDLLGTTDYDFLDDTDDIGLEKEHAGRPSGGEGFDAQQCILDGYSAVPSNYGGSSYNNLPNSISTGRSYALSLEEQIAMRAARTNPQDGRVIMKNLHDTRFAGYMKYSRHYKTRSGGVEIHYIGDPATNTFGDFKFK